MESLDYKLEKTRISNEIILENNKYFGEFHDLKLDSKFNLKGYWGFEKYEINKVPVLKAKKKPRRHRLQLIPEYEKVKVDEKIEENKVIDLDECYSFNNSERGIILDNKGLFTNYKEILMINLSKSSNYVISRKLIDKLFDPIERQILEMYCKYKSLLDPALIKKKKKKDK